MGGVVFPISRNGSCPCALVSVFAVVNVIDGRFERNGRTIVVAIDYEQTDVVASLKSIIGSTTCELGADGNR